MNNDDILPYLEKLFLFIPAYGDFGIEDLLWEIDFREELEKPYIGNIFEAKINLNQIIRHAISLGYTTLIKQDEIDSVGSIFALTVKGREAKEAGGHFAYLEKIAKQTELAQEKKTKEEQDRVYQKIISGLTLLAVIAAVVVSVVSLYYSNKGEEAKITTQEQLQEQMKLQKKLLLKTDSMQLLINTLISRDSLPKKHL